MSQRDPNLEEQALERLRAALTAADATPADVDDTLLLGLMHGTLGPDDRKRALKALAASSALRAYLVEASREVDDRRMARALAVMGSSAALQVDPFADPLAPEAPRGYAISGPFGAIRATMSSEAESSDDSEPAIFGPDSVLEWIVRADDPLPAVYSLWLRRPGQAYARVTDPEVEQTADAARILIAAARLFPDPGRWDIALVGGRGGHPDTPADCLQVTATRFVVDPIRLA